MIELVKQWIRQNFFTKKELVDSGALDSRYFTEAEVNAHTSATAAHGATGAVVGTTNTQTLTNKTLTAPTISTITNTGTLTLPTSTDTLVGRATTDTLTNKTLTAPVMADFTNAAHTHQAAASGGQLTTAALSDYAAGTFTPGLTFGGGSTGMTFTSRSGRYIRIGNLIYMSADMRLSAKGSSTGAAKITSLPFTAVNDDAVGNAIVLWYQMATNWVHVGGAVEKNTTNFFLVGFTAAGASYTNLFDTDFANNSIISFSCMYEKAV